MTAIMAVAARHNLAVVEDAAQAHLATADGRPVGTIGVAGAFSFYPTKNLGALGDGGAVVTSDAALAARIKRLRNGGQTTRYHHEEAGANSRLDELQAAILRARLPLSPRAGPRGGAQIAAALSRAASPPPASPCRAQFDAGHVYHLFPVLTTRARRGAGAPRGARRRDADSLSRADSAAAGAAVHRPAAVPGGRSRVRRDLLAADVPVAERCRRDGGRRGGQRVRAALRSELRTDSPCAS